MRASTLHTWLAAGGALALGGLLALAGCARSVDAPSSESFGATVEVAKHDLRREVLADGTLNSPAAKQITVPRIRWYWTQNIAWTAAEGIMVKAGDVVVKLDPATIQKDLVEEETALEVERLKLREMTISGTDKVADAQADVTTKEFELKRARLLYVDSDSVSENEKQRQRLEISAAEAALARAHERVKAVEETVAREREGQQVKVTKAEKSVDLAREGLDKLIMKAPQDGMLLFPLFATQAGWRKAATGVTVEMNTLVAEVADPADLVARLYVPEVDATGIVSGTPGHVVLDVDPLRTISGSVKHVSTVPTTPGEREGRSKPTAQDNVRQVEVHLSLAERPSMAVPGLTVRARLAVLSIDGVASLPIEALSPTPGNGKALAEAAKQESASSQRNIQPGSTVYVYARRAGDANFDWREVQVGAIALTHAEVKSGLQVGDAVKLLSF